MMPRDGLGACFACGEGVGREGATAGDATHCSAEPSLFHREPAIVAREGRSRRYNSPLMKSRFFSFASGLWRG